MIASKGLLKAPLLGIKVQPELIRQIAREVLAGAVLDNWRFYALMVCLTLVSSALGSYAGAYWKRRGETAAMRRDTQAILDQLKQTTRVAEEVRTQVSHADWVAREWRTVRRTKLEELLVMAVTMDEWLETMGKKWVYLEEVTIDDPERLDRFNALVALYFPELRLEATTIVKSYRSIYSIQLDCHSAIRTAVDAKDAAAHQAAMDTFTKRWQPAYAKARESLGAFEDKCVQLMQTLAQAAM